ncbi:hypothetical protein [Variovorax sp. GT1P44]|uniref:hypothetical protein n=1 Tax=Variovorax sp. GT1P44 TaxID=3443742 RepID=UPI003F46E21F
MTLARLACTHPRIIDWGIHLDRAPAAGWLALQAAAFTPVWTWMPSACVTGPTIRSASSRSLPWQC